MFSQTARWSAVLGLLLVSGCCFPVNEKIDLTVCDLAARPRDLQPADQGPLPTAQMPALADGLTPAAYQPKGGTAPELKGKGHLLTIPPELMPGGPVPELKLPRATAENEAVRRKAIENLYPTLPPLAEEPPPQLGPAGLPLTLSDLQRLALANSPLIKQAAANIEAARGAAIQAGLPPNPVIAFENDTIGTTGGGGYQGGYIEQKIITWGKLQLSRAVSAMDLRNAELALRKAETDLSKNVRGGYFAVLVAHEGVRVNRALVRFTDEVYRLQVVGQLRPGQAAPYEPAYLRSLAYQARANLIQSRNRYASAWKQLAANLGLPGLPLTQLAGRIDMPIPAYDHKDVLARVLANHTDMRTALNTYHQAILSVKLAKAQPLPDPTVHVLVQQDRTGPPFEISPSVTVSFPIPVWDRNQGGIMQAQGKLANANEEPHRVRSALTAALADAFERYENGRMLLAIYRDRLLPDQVRVYRGVYDRYQRGELGGVNVGDVVVAQQNLAGSIGSYLTTLGQMWQAVVDVTDLLQTDDMFQFNGQSVPTVCVPGVPDLENLPGLPCCHPCSPTPGAHQHVQEGTWPTADPERSATPPVPPAPAPLPMLSTPMALPPETKR